MKLKATICVLAALGFAACDGGSSGTGITTAQGNVASVGTASRAAPRDARPTLLAMLWNALQGASVANARGPVEDIRVTIEGTGFAVQTDPQGQFGLSGDFAGPIGMVFELPDGGSARLVVTIPRGGALTLTNVHVDGRSGRATADDQRVRFDGLVDATDCAQSSATVVSRRSPDDGNHYTVHFSTATVHDPSGAAVGCSELSPGAVIDVDGRVRREGEVEADSVEVEHESGDGSGSSGEGRGGGDSGSREGSDNGSGSSGEGSGKTATG